jgi:hypothetical protein
VTSYESFLANATERYMDYGTCDECGDLHHRAELLDGLCDWCLEDE